MSKEVVITDEIDDEIYSYRFFERFYSNMVLDKDSFVHLPSFYKFGLPAIILVVITALKLGTAAILINKIQFDPCVYPPFV